MTTPYNPLPGGLLTPGQSGGAYGKGVLADMGVSLSGGSTVNPNKGGYITGPNSKGAQSAQIYMGKQKGPGVVYDIAGGAHPANKPPTDKYMSYQEARLLPTGWSNKQLKEFTNKLTMYGFQGFGEGQQWGMPEVMSAWEDLVSASANFSTGKKKFTPWDILESYNKKPGSMGTIKKDGWVFDAATGDRLSYEGPKTKTQTSKQVDLSSAEQVQALSRQVLRELLGRAPSDEEFAQYKDSINNYERENPLVTTTTSTITDAQIQEAIKNNTDIDWSTAATSSVSSGGVTADARAELLGESAREKPEYAKYQGGTTYWNAMLQVLGGIF